MRILVVEDSAQLRKSVVAALQESGHAVDEAPDGEEGLWFAETYAYDLLVLDIMLPGIDGTAILEKVRAGGGQTPVMFLTAKDTVEDRVKGLQMGADDYLIKPFALEELLARVQALTRRAYGKAENKLCAGDLEIDMEAKKVTRAGTVVDLPAREYALLEYLALRAGSVVSRTEIEEHIYDDLVSPMSNVVDAAIYTLRKKLMISPSAQQLIHTRRGQGYVLEIRD